MSESGSSQNSVPDELTLDEVELGFFEKHEIALGSMRESDDSEPEDKNFNAKGEALGKKELDTDGDESMLPPIDLSDLSAWTSSMATDSDLDKESTSSTYKDWTIRDTPPDSPGKELSSEILERKREKPAQEIPKIVKVVGDGSCGFHAMAIGIIENIYSKELFLDAKKHQSFLTFIGNNCLAKDKAASVEEAVIFFRTNYQKRCQSDFYKEITENVLRPLTATRVKENWLIIVNQMLETLKQMAENSKESDGKSLNESTFKALFDASSLKEGDFGKQLRELALTTPIGSDLWIAFLRFWLEGSKDKYIDQVVNKLWASKEIELPLLGEYFDISILECSSAQPKDIYKGASGKIQLVQKSGHFDYLLLNNAKRPLLNSSSSLFYESSLLGVINADPSSTSSAHSNSSSSSSSSSSNSSSSFHTTSF